MAMHPLSRAVCCDLAVKMFLDPKFDFKVEFRKSLDRAVWADNPTEMLNSMNILAKDQASVVDSAMQIYKVAMEKAEKDGRFDIREWFENLGFGK